MGIPVLDGRPFDRNDRAGSPRVVMGRPGFILQHVVDAYGAQTATSDSKPIGIVFALVGLHLHVEKHFQGARFRRSTRSSHGESEPGRSFVFRQIAAT